MRLRIGEDLRTVEVDVETLGAFARQKSGAPTGFRPSFGDGSAGGDAEDVVRDVPVSIVRQADGFSFVFYGNIDAVTYDGTTLCCETRKRVRRNPAHIRPGDDAAFLARVMISAYMLAESMERESIAIRMAFVRESDGDVQCWEGMFARTVLARAMDALFERAAPFLVLEARRLGEGRAQLKSLRFPYPTIREGQRDLMEETFRCARTGRRLLAGAPTGIGKTMSGVYPSLRALGAGYADRVFYFTAKTVTGNVALDAVKTLSEQCPSLRCCRIAAKERLCPRRKNGESERGMCRRCPLLAPVGKQSYEERRDRALLAVLESGSVYDSPLMVRIAEQFGICPYELSLDVSEYCDMIVCDYGYLLDPHVRFQRYFVQDRGEKYIFLFDEAHNLPDRARETYSATLARSEFLRFAETARGALPDDRPLADSCDCMSAAFDGIEAMCAAESEESPDGDRAGCVLLSEVPDFFVEATGRLRAVCDEYLRRDYENAAPLFEDMRAALRQFGECAALADETFSFYCESVGGECTAQLMCLDPSRLLDEAMKRAVSTSLFSATLSPMDYYADVCGCKNAVKLELPSPYERDNLCLVTVDSVSTRLTSRKDTSADVAELIAAVTESRAGNYIVYFPSYKYMNAVCRQYLRLSPGSKVIMQKQGMSIGERDRFLRAFAASAARGESLTAFCVLGGIFSEGIDLRGESLIGSIIVGIGLPGLSSQLNILAEYYDKTRESGRDYAYLYPAMNKILQAAGRVIRSEEDRGVVVLIDDRYADPGIRKLFPSHWSRMQYTGDAYSLSRILEKFWET